MNLFKKLTRHASILAATTLIHFSASADYVYQNTTTDLNTRFNPSTSEVGDEINLIKAGVTLTNFSFSYWGTNFLDGGESARVRFYYMDGTNSSSGPPVPGTKFFDSGVFGISATSRATLSFDLPNIVATASNITWTVQFNFNGAPNEGAGVDIFSGPTVGNNYDDYWQSTGGGGWELRTNATTPMNFAASFEAVPEPSTVVLGVMGLAGLVGLSLHRRFRKSNA